MGWRPQGWPDVVVGRGMGDTGLAQGSGGHGLALGLLSHQDNGMGVWSLCAPLASSCCPSGDGSKGTGGCSLHREPQD